MESGRPHGAGKFVEAGERKPQGAEENRKKRNPTEPAPVWLSVSFTNPHLSIMKHFNLWACALLISVGLSSCALSYPYCDAYNGVEFEQSAPVDAAESGAETPAEH